MKHKKLRFGQRFRVAIGNRRWQAAEMVIPPGGGEGDPRNRHRSANQWLFVIAGRSPAPRSCASRGNVPSGKRLSQGVTLGPHFRAVRGGERVMAIVKPSSS